MPAELVLSDGILCLFLKVELIGFADGTDESFAGRGVKSGHKGFSIRKGKS